MADRAPELPAPAGPNLAALAAITDAVEDGAGLPAVLRAAARALDTSLILIDRSASVLAVAARSPADERSLMRDGDDVTTIDLKVADATVGKLRLRVAERPLDASLLRLVTTLIASEVERVRAPERASEEAATTFQREVLSGRIEDREDLIAQGKELGTDLGPGASVVIIRAHPRSPTEEDWRRRMLALVARGARSLAPGALAAPTSDAEGAEIAVLLPDSDGEVGRRAAASILRELESGLPGFSFAVGRSRRVEDPLELHRARNEALLAANVVEGEPERVELSYEETGTYQLLLPHMNDPVELRRFYDETVRPLVGLRRAVRNRPARHPVDVPGMRRQRERDRVAPDHAPPHGPLPVRARARVDRPRRVLHRRSREALARAQGDAGARNRAAARSRPRARGRGRTGTAVGDER